MKEEDVSKLADGLSATPFMPMAIQSNSEYLMILIVILMTMGCFDKKDNELEKRIGQLEGKMSIIEKLIDK